MPKKSTRRVVRQPQPEPEAPALSELAQLHDAALAQDALQAPPEGEGAAEAPAALPGAPDAPAAAKEPTRQMVLACRMLVSSAGGIVCGRAKVAQLTPDEVAMLSEAAANLAAQYDLERIDPKAAAWIGLGLSVAAVVQPRLNQLGGQEAAPAEAPVGYVAEAS